MIHRIFAIALVCSTLSLFLAPAAAEARCRAGELSVQLPFPIRQLNSPPNPTVDFTIQRRNPSVDCDFWVGFSKGQAPTYDRKLFSGGTQLDYDIFKTPTSAPLQLKSHPDAVSLGEVYTARFNKGGRNPNQQTFSTYPRVISPLPGPFNIQPPGSYSDVVQIRVFEGSFPPSGSPTEIVSASQRYFYTVAPFAIVSLLDAGTPYTEPPVSLKTLNFGTLTTGESMSFELVLLYNSGYRVRFTSQYGSRLKHSTAASYVPYTIQAGGVPVTLNAGSAVQVASGNGVGPSAPAGHRLPVVVNIGATEGRLSGQYADSVTIEMTSL